MKKAGLLFLLSISIAILALRPFESGFFLSNSSSLPFSYSDRVLPFNHALPLEVLYSSRNGRLVVISENPARIIEFNPASLALRNLIDLTQKPTGAVLSGDSERLFVTLGGPDGKISEVDIPNQKVIRTFSTRGHTPVSPVLSPDEKTLYVCNRFNNEVVVIDLDRGRVINRFQVVREPTSMVISNNGKYLFVGNFLPSGPSNAERVNSEISVIDLGPESVRSIELPNGSNSIGGMTLSPDGRYVYITHVLARFQVPTTQIERGWINTNALSIIDAESQEFYASVLLDDVDLGFANPRAISCSPDGRLLLITSFGANELSVINRDKLHSEIEDTESLSSFSAGHYSDMANDLSFMHRINRQRIRLPGYGPNSVVIAGGDVYIAEYYSGTLSVLDMDGATVRYERQFALGEMETVPDMVRYGDMLFNSSDLCFQKWQSCASCHPGDARMDGLNWDLLNDGVGNPKNTRSMLYAHQTPPSMSLGVRATAEDAVRAGIRFIQFAEVDESKAGAIDIYLKSLRPEPSPYLVNNRLSRSARRGKRLFEREGCADCHPSPLYNNLKRYNLGYVGSSIDTGKKFENATLIEVWRTAPYLHDGSARTMDELIRIHNPYGTSELTDEERADLAEYVLSL
jgi:YVTN family beta-propeller protein